MEPGSRSVVDGTRLGVAGATMGRMLVVMSGRPGTGNSTIADALSRELGAPVLSRQSGNLGRTTDW
jgi:hypothetical protein